MFSARLRKKQSSAIGIPFDRQNSFERDAMFVGNAGPVWQQLAESKPDSQFSYSAILALTREDQCRSCELDIRVSCFLLLHFIVFLQYFLSGSVRSNSSLDFEKDNAADNFPLTLTAERKQILSIDPISKIRKEINFSPEQKNNDNTYASLI